MSKDSRSKKSAAPCHIWRFALLPFVSLVAFGAACGDAQAFATQVLPHLVAAVPPSQPLSHLFWTVKADNLLPGGNDRFHISEIVGVTGQAAPVDLELPPFGPTDYLLLSFRGLPKDFALSSGFRTSDAWLVSAHESKDLQIMPPDDFSGSFTMEVRLIRGQNVVARTQVVRITFSPPDESSQQTVPVSEEPPLTGEKSTAAIPAVAMVVAHMQPEEMPDHRLETPAMPKIGVEQESYLLGLAQEMLDQNDIAAARSIYRRLAYNNSIRGTLRLAQSYDPAFLSQFQTVNILEDLAEARRWYERAADLGADEALQRLTALNAHFD